MERLKRKYWRGADGAVIPAADLMELNRTYQAIVVGVPNNSFCPCGSYKKFKTRCGGPLGESPSDF